MSELACMTDSTERDEMITVNLLRKPIIINRRMSYGNYFYLSQFAQ